MKQVKVVQKQPKATLGQLFQSLKVQFSFTAEKVVDGKTEFHNLTQYVLCRDFLGDMLWSKHWNKESYIYGLSYNWREAPYDEDHLKLTIFFPDGEKRKAFLKNVPEFLHAKEDQAGVERTEILETQFKDKFIVIGSPHWQKSTWRLSLYTYYLKLCCLEDPKNVPERSSESDYAKVLSKEAEDTYLKHVTDDFVFFYDNIYMSHNNSGFYSLLTLAGTPFLERNEDYSHLFGKKSKKMRKTPNPKNDPAVEAVNAL